MADAATSLTPDIQRALQQAVGNANDAAHLSEKKKKKRSRDAEPDESGTKHAEDGEKRRKKKKKHHAQHDNAADNAQTVSEQPVVELDIASQEKQTEGKKKKKKSKDKHHATQAAAASSAEAATTSEPRLHDEQQVNVRQGHAPAHVEEDLGASSADFLSAVVAAASATSQIQPPLSDFPHGSVTFPPFPEQFSPYPPPQFPYPPPLPPPFGPTAHQPDFGDIDLGMVSSEDLLHTLQQLDITKIASVLKTITDAGVAAHGPSMGIPPSFVPAPPPPGPPPVNQTAVKSDAILGRPPKQAKQSSQNTGTLPTPRGHTPATALPQEGNPDHAHMLANVWLSASKLSEMAKEQGLVYKKGKFSAMEEGQLRAAIENYRVAKGLAAEDLTELIFSRDKNRDAFWVEITSALHLRPIISVYHHVRRMWHPMRGQGKWMPCEDEALRSAIEKFGQAWEKVSQFVGRSGPDCRDRYRNHLEEKGKRKTGAWTKEEEEELTQIVTEMTVQQGKDTDSEIFWGIVSKRMGGRRGKQQCRIKWLDSLSGKFKNEGKQVRWSQLDAYILVHKIDSLNVHDDSEIDWKTLPDEHWNNWSAHALQRRWLCMKRSVKGYEDMSHAELMDILRTKKAQSPGPSTARPHKKITSAETIESDEEDSVAGPSTGTVTSVRAASTSS